MPPPAVERIRATLARLHQEGVVLGTSGSRFEIIPKSIPKQLGDELAEYVQREDARKTVEVGLAHGVSALHICCALVELGGREVQHVTIDPHQQSGFESCGLGVLRTAGVRDLVEHHEERSQVVLPRLVTERRTFDLAFVDGSHHFEEVFVDLSSLGQLARPGGVIIADDYTLPAVAKAAQFFVANRAWELEGLLASRAAALRLPPARPDRDFRDFVDF